MGRRMVTRMDTRVRGMNGGEGEGTSMRKGKGKEKKNKPK